MSFDLKISAGDLVINSGELVTTTNEDKLVQDILKICLTKAGSNLYQPWYGSAIGQSLVGSVLDDNISFTLASSQLQNALENLKKLQELQVISGQKVSPQEQIALISDISIIRNNVDPRLIEVLIKVFNKAFKLVSTGFTANNLT